MLLLLLLRLGTSVDLSISSGMSTAWYLFISIVLLLLCIVAVNEFFDGAVVSVIVVEVEVGVVLGFLQLQNWL